jgi:hypothetical protein
LHSQLSSIEFACFFVFSTSISRPCKGNKSNNTPKIFAFPAPTPVHVHPRQCQKKRYTIRLYYVDASHLDLFLSTGAVSYTRPLSSQACNVNLQPLIPSPLSGFIIILYMRHASTCYPACVPILGLYALPFPGVCIFLCIPPPWTTVSSWSII